MPTYDYQCEGCGHTFEKFQSITASPVRVCPVCKKRKVKRLIGAGAGIIFKGSGFYQTDYRSDSYTKAAQKDKDGSGSSTSSSESKSDSTSETKKESSPSTSGDSGKKD